MDAQTRLDAALALSATLRHRELRVALFLLRYSDVAGEWLGTFDDVRRVTGDSWRTVARSFQTLQSAGVIHRVIGHSHATRWRLVCQNWHSTGMTAGGMPFPPTPPLCGAPVPESLPPSATPARGMPKLAYQNGGGGGMDYGDLTEPATDAQRAAVAELLAEVRNDSTRDEIAARCSPELVRFAVQTANRAPNARDRFAFAVHLLRSGSAARAFATEREKIAAIESRKQERLAAARSALADLDGRDEARERAAAAIDAAPLPTLRAALARAIAAVPGASAFHRADAPEPKVRAMAKSGAYRDTVAELLTQSEGINDDER